MNFVMTDGRCIKGTSWALCKGIWVLQIVFVFPVCLFRGMSGTASRVVMWPIEIARPGRLRTLECHTYLLEDTCVPSRPPRLASAGPQGLATCSVGKVGSCMHHWGFSQAGLLSDF